MLLELALKAPWLSGPCAYGVHANPTGYQAPAHVRLISDAFRRCAMTRAGRLMVIAPPRHGKSTTCSHYGPAWYLGVHPQRRVIFGSHTAHFAGTWGEKVRKSVDEHGAISGARLGDRRAMQDWITTLGGGMRSVGARKGAGATGLGAHLIVMDDSVASQQDALSETVQQGTWEWWQADFSTRKESPDTSIVVIGTRWSERDLLGRLLAAREEGPRAEGYEPWEILYLPAIYDGLDWTGERPHVDPLGRDIGEALWPERWPVEYLKAEEKRKPWWYAALFQGRPQPLEGGLLKQTWWNYWRPAGDEYDDLGPVIIGDVTKEAVVLPAVAQATISVDANFLADVADIAKGRERSDVAVHAWALGVDGTQAVLDRELGMFDIDGTAQTVIAMRDRHKSGEAVAQVLGLDLPPMPALVEAKANGPAVMAKLRHKGITCIPATPTESKLARVIGRGDTDLQKYGRASSFADDAKAGKIFLPHPGLVIGGRSYAWVLDLRHNFAKFPRSGTDDTDAASQAWAKLAVVAWSAESLAASQELQAEAKTRRLAGLPKAAKLPETTADYVSARKASIIDALTAKAMRRVGQANEHRPLRRRRGRWA